MTTIAIEEGPQQIQGREWHDGFNWWQHPVSAYAKGMDDGYRLGYTAAYNEIVAHVLTQFGSTDPHVAMDEAVRRFDVLQARSKFDQETLARRSQP